MEKKHFTTSEFANLHNINKRTLHYYDNIGLFSPEIKGENNYRYYSFSQSIKLDYILMLKKVGMSIDEIKLFLQHPSSSKFLDIAEDKIPKLDDEIKRLKIIKDFLQHKQSLLKFCKTINESSIQISSLNETYLLTTPVYNSNSSINKIYNDLKQNISTKQSILGYGSYIDIKKILKKDFNYDGSFAYIKKKENTNNLLVLPKGSYLCAYFKGSWDNLPKFYNEIIKFSNKHNIVLSGYAYEMGLNDFVSSSNENYITQIIIKIEI